jgi:hypothetical protein
VAVSEPYRAGVEADARHELDATVAARRELGPEHEDALIAGFLERIEHEIDRRVEERVGRRTQWHPQLGQRDLGAAVPIVVVAGIFGGPAGVFVALAVLLVVFLVRSFAGRSAR